MGLVNSTNPKTMAENIKKLETMVKEAGSELPTPGAGDTGKILKVGSDGYELSTEYSYTPPAYSSTAEVNTGRKWIDGKDIYMITINNSLDENGASSIDLTDLSIDFLVNVEGTMVHETSTKMIPFNYYSGANSRVNGSYDYTAKTFSFATASTYANDSYYLTLFYTKETPTP